MANEVLQATQEVRLDKFLAQELATSRNQVEQLIKKGYVRINDAVVTKGGVKLKRGDSVEVTLPQPMQNEAYGVDFDVEKIYEDEEILVINKPSGVVVHPAPSVKSATLVDWLKSQGIRLSTISGEERHGIVHRIDKETSGLLVVAKTNEAHQKLAQQLQDKSMGRYYLSLVTPPLKSNVIVERPIGRNPKNRLKMAIIEGGRAAKSAFAKIATSKDEKTELIAAKLFTGRTHQIRVHLSSIGRHILGDGLYGFKSKKDTIPRVFLHAYILYLRHPKTGAMMRFVAPLPQDMHAYLQKHFETEPVDEKISPDSLESLFDFSRGMWDTADAQ